MSEKLNNAIENLKEIMKEEKIDPRNGLPLQLFLLSTCLSPTVNIDLLVVDKKKGVLLAYRDDPYWEGGWHIPGGCVRMHERLEDRVHSDAIKELGCDVKFNSKPICIKEDIVKIGERPWMENEFERGHGISFLYKCELPKDYDENKYNKDNNLKEGQSGYLRWFKETPDNLLKCHKRQYGDILKEALK